MTTQQILDPEFRDVVLSNIFFSRDIDNALIYIKKRQREVTLFGPKTWPRCRFIAKVVGLRYLNKLVNKKAIILR